MEAQSAMEYIIIWGSALVIVAIAIVLLYKFIPSATSPVPILCNFVESGITCQDILAILNPVTANTVMVIEVINSGTSPISGLSTYVLSANQVKSQAAQCIPNYIVAGGTAICEINFPINAQPNELLTGKIYASFSSCALTTAKEQPGTCTGLEQTYLAAFTVPVAPSNGGLNIQLTLTPKYPSVPADGTEDPVYADLMWYPPTFNSA